MCAIVFCVSTSRHISLWVPEELLAQLDVCAHEANRTRSQEIVLRLRESVQLSLSEGAMTVLTVSTTTD